MTDIVILVLVLLIAVLALLRSKKHFKGGCCGSGSNTIRSRKTLTDPKIGEKVLTVEGMHCGNCQARVENALNRLDGVACLVNLKKKTATVTYSREVTDAELKDPLEKLGYRVTQIR